PWELARMHHLATLALAYSQTHDNALFTEFRSQVLDFIALNPPGFGINWACTMDVAIRAANILVAYDIFLASGATPDSAFADVLARCIRSHGRHISANLEWTPELSLLGNHYLCNIAGLIFTAAYLPSSPETDLWLAFGISELESQVERQFFEDGSNFEASTCYHRLTAEAVAFATAIASGIPAERLQNAQQLSSTTNRASPLPWHRIRFQMHDAAGMPRRLPLSLDHFHRLSKMAAFLADITTSQNEFPQIGDNDNGRFLKLIPAISAGGAPERHLDPAPTLSAIGALLGNKEVSCCESRLIAGLMRGAMIPPDTGGAARTGKPTQHKGFGLYSYRTEQLLLIARCGPIGKNGYGGHGHNDQLSFVLSLHGSWVFVDPGSYVYTPLPDKRNLFRSTSMHNTLSVPGLEQNPWKAGRTGLFSMTEKTCARISVANASEFVAEHSGYGEITRRSMAILPDALEGLDECQVAGEKRVNFHLAPDLRVELSGNTAIIMRDKEQVCQLSTSSNLGVEKTVYSPSYGTVQSNFRLVVEDSSTKMDWKITW
ncbi:MAG: heparinase, partial [Verrucomicrobia bacterium]|nr:heparinase [Verrucomicrobiota bacterium]